MRRNCYYTFTRAEGHTYDAKRMGQHRLMRMRRTGAYLATTPANIDDPPFCPCIPPRRDFHMEFVFRYAYGL